MGRHTGFTLIELMIVVAIIAILVVIAVPVYQNYQVRSRVTEGLVLAAAAKASVATDGTSTVAGLANVAATWNARANNTGETSKYVKSVQIDPASGMITITYNAAPVGLQPGQDTLTLTPWVRYNGTGQALAAAIAAGHSGAVDWGCASTSNMAATASGITPVAPGTLPARYTPSQCR